MKKVKAILLALAVLFLLGGFGDDGEDLDLASFGDYQKEYESIDVGVCSYSSVKTYMDYRAVTSPSSTQYWYIRRYMYVDPTGLLIDEDGFIGVALGSYYGVIGDRYYFTLDNGTVLPVVKIDEKADEDTLDGCNHGEDGSVIEFVIDKNLAGNYFGVWENGLILSGNFNNTEVFRGSIAKVEKVTGEKNEHYVTYEEKEETAFDNEDIFSYGGY